MLPGFIYLKSVLTKKIRTPCRLEAGISAFTFHKIEKRISTAPE
jgi:hypothetical protein